MATDINSVLNKLRTKTEQITGQLRGEKPTSTSNAQNKIFETFANILGQPQVTAPIPDEHILDDPAERYYFALNQMKEDWASRLNQQDPQHMVVNAPAIVPQLPMPEMAKAQPQKNSFQKMVDKGVQEVQNFFPQSQEPAPLPTNTPLDWQRFVESAKRVAEETGYPLGVILGQAALETGRTSAPGNNFFGIKGSGTAGTQNLATKEATTQGQFYDTRSNFAAYKTPEDSIRAYINLIKNNYPQAYASRNDPVGMVRAIKAGGYATDPDYVTKVTGTPEFQNYSKAQPKAQPAKPQQQKKTQQISQAVTQTLPARVPMPAAKPAPKLPGIFSSPLMAKPQPKPAPTILAKRNPFGFMA